jgi:GNAT superfamily N-acetyltransferase
VLEAGAVDATLVRAAAENQTTWLTRIAEAAGGFVTREQGVTWTRSPAGAALAFPQLSRERLDEVLPRFLEAAEGAPEASCWSLLPTQPPGLHEVLLAAGFREGWQANWMAIDVKHLSAPLRTEGVEVALVADWTPTELPWDGAGITRVRELLAAERPRNVWHVAAWRTGEPVGHATLSVTRGELGVAGIYDMGVAAPERRRGIGSTLTAMLLDLARGEGCAVATLNATPEGERLYRELGFRHVGVAQTWWR